MPISTFVSVLLAVCWMLPAISIAVWYGIWYRQHDASDREAMLVVRREVRAEILQVDYDAKNADWRSEDWEGPGASVRSQVQGRSHEVAVPTQYAEATVSVHCGEDEEESRSCSLCLN